MAGGILRKPQGYTIVEVMIFLAISGVTFVLAAAFISGRQDVVQFRQGMSDTDTKVRGVINDVANGQYPVLDNGVYCQAPGLGVPTFQSAGTKGQGENIGCIFMGKVFQPAIDNDRTAFAEYSVIGRQFNNGNDAVVDFASAMPVAVDESSIAKLVFKRSFSSGLEFTKAKLCSPTNCQPPTSTGTDISAVGFFGSFGTYSASVPGTLESGAQSIITAVFPPNAPPNNSTEMALNINTNLRTYTSTSPMVVSGRSYVLFCFEYGTKKGSLTIGGTNGQQLTTTIELGQGVAPLCLT